jgi:hypothetical protein
MELVRRVAGVKTTGVCYRFLYCVIVQVAGPSGLTTQSPVTLETKNRDNSTGIRGGKANRRESLARPEGFEPPTLRSEV